MILYCRGGLDPSVSHGMRSPGGVGFWALEIMYNKALELHLIQPKQLDFTGNLRDFQVEC